MSVAKTTITVTVFGSSRLWSTAKVAVRKTHLKLSTRFGTWRVARRVAPCVEVIMLNSPALRRFLADGQGLDRGVTVGSIGAL